MLSIRVEIHQEQSQIRPIDNPRIIGSYQKIQRDLGWKPTIPFEQSLQSMYQYWDRANRERIEDASGGYSMRLKNMDLADVLNITIDSKDRFGIAFEGDAVKIAIFHDYFGAIGGGERVVVTMAKILNADIITTDTDAIKKIDPSVHVISLGKTIQFPPLKQISASIKFFSVIIQKSMIFLFSVGIGLIMPHTVHHPNIWYCYTPVRAFYDLYPTFLSRQDFVTRQFFRFWVFLHRWFDQRSVTHIDRIIAISRNVQNRILHYHHRDGGHDLSSGRYFAILVSGVWRLLAFGEPALPGKKD